MSPDPVLTESDTSGGVLLEVAFGLGRGAESRAQAVSRDRDDAQKSRTVLLRGRHGPPVP